MIGGGSPMGHGGARPGSGRPPKAVLYGDSIRMAERKILDRLPWIVERLFELAAGIKVESSGLDGAPVVYQKAPDRAACEYLMDRIMGKPTQPVDIRDRAQRLADELGMPVEVVIAEAEHIAAGRR